GLLFSKWMNLQSSNKHNRPSFLKRPDHSTSSPYINKHSSNPPVRSKASHLTIKNAPTSQSLSSGSAYTGSGSNRFNKFEKIFPGGMMKKDLRKSLKL